MRLKFCLILLAFVLLLVSKEVIQANVGRKFRVKQKNLNLDEYKNNLIENSEFDNKNNCKFSFSFSFSNLELRVSLKRINLVNSIIKHFKNKQSILSIESFY